MLRRKTATYALLAMYEIAQQGGGEDAGRGVRAADIARKHKLPHAYAAKILSQLASSGILHSNRGPRGGFRLNRSPEKISLLDVFDGAGALMPFDVKGDTLKGLPPLILSAMNKTQREATSLLKDLFHRTSLKDILNHSRSG